MLLFFLAVGLVTHGGAQGLSGAATFSLSGESAGSREYNKSSPGNCLSITDDEPPGSSGFGDPLGLVTLAGYVVPHAQAWVDELQMANLGVRVTHGKVHSVFTVGALYSHPDLTWSVGYGIGKHIPFSRFSLNIDALVQLLNVEKFDPGEFELLTRLRLSAEWRLNHNLNAFAGISWNNLHLPSAGAPTCPEWRSESARGGRTWKSRWPGFFVGVEF